ncbi:hypothetical protein [Bacillus paranthracis]|nr:hypothetical protein [Bacillus paranthracis]
MKEITIKIRGNVDKHDINDMKHWFQDFMEDGSIEFEVVNEEEVE